MQTARCLNINLCTLKSMWYKPVSFLDNPWLPFSSASLLLCLPPSLYFTPLIPVLSPLFNVYFLLLISRYFYFPPPPSPPLISSPSPLWELSVHLFSKWKDELFVWCGRLAGCSVALWVNVPHTYATRWPYTLCVCVCVCNACAWRDEDLLV